MHLPEQAACCTAKFFPMNPSTLITPILASGGGHGYLYGLFFLILSLIIGAAARHFLHKEIGRAHV